MLVVFMCTVLFPVFLVFIYVMISCVYPRFMARQQLLVHPTRTFHSGSGTGSDDLSLDVV